MKTELSREQILSTVARARQQRSLAAGGFWANTIRSGLARLGHSIDQSLHILLMSPTTRHR